MGDIRIQFLVGEVGVRQFKQQALSVCQTAKSMQSYRVRVQERVILL
jgi:hypothetical protein